MRPEQWGVDDGTTWVVRGYDVTICGNSIGSKLNELNVPVWYASVYDSALDIVQGIILT